jgi:hypothetical protein
MTNLHRFHHLCRVLFLLSFYFLPTISNYHCTISLKTGQPTCHPSNNNNNNPTFKSNHKNIKLSSKTIQKLSLKLYNLRKTKNRKRKELEQVPHLIQVVERSFNTSCLPTIVEEDQSFAGVCAELSLQLCALNREAHFYHSAVKACKQGVHLATIASMKQTKAWDKGDEFAALRMRGKAALARAYGDIFQYDKSLQVMKDIHAAFGPDVPMAARFVLMDLHCELLLCSGDVHMSLMTYEKAFGSLNINRSIQNLRRHIELIDASMSARPPPPLDVRRAMLERRKETVKSLLRVGTWNNIHQLPLNYILKFKPLGPYPKLSDVSIHIQNIIQTIEMDTVLISNLKKEVQSLMKKKSVSNENEHDGGGAFLERDRECIHSKIIPNKSGGLWYRYSPTGYWHGNHLNLETQCTSALTPVVCSLYEKLTKQSPIVIRLGYSVIKRNTWIRPHYGRTNSQLKLHLGLVIPKDGHGVYKCPAEIRVGMNEGEESLSGSHSEEGVRQWEYGKILLFDDSYQHEVYNGCDTDRAVLQIVVQRNLDDD